MSPLWVLPLIVVSVGVIAVARAASSLAAATADLAARGGALNELAREAQGLRDDVDAVTARARALRWRSAAETLDR